MTLHIAITRRNCYYTTRASVYISKSQEFQYTGICYILYPGRHILCPSQHIFTSWPAYHGKEQNASMPAYHGKEQNASMPAYHGKEQDFSMPAYHGKSKILVCWHIIARVRFQYASISWHEQSFSMPAYHGKSKISVCWHIMAKVRFQYAGIS
jgi:hypothetical protein